LPKRRVVARAIARAMEMVRNGMRLFYHGCCIGKCLLLKSSLVPSTKTRSSPNHVPTSSTQSFYLDQRPRQPQGPRQSREGRRASPSRPICRPVLEREAEEHARQSPAVARSIGQRRKRPPTPGGLSQLVRSLWNALRHPEEPIYCVDCAAESGKGERYREEYLAHACVGSRADGCERSVVRRNLVRLHAEL
jgi:hypothetical protein